MNIKILAAVITFAVAFNGCASTPPVALYQLPATGQMLACPQVYSASNSVVVDGQAVPTADATLGAEALGANIFHSSAYDACKTNAEKLGYARIPNEKFTCENSYGLGYQCTSRAGK